MASSVDRHCSLRMWVDATAQLEEGSVFLAVRRTNEWLRNKISLIEKRCYQKLSTLLEKPPKVASATDP